MDTSIGRDTNSSLMLGIMYSVLLLVVVAGELEFATQVGLSLSPGCLAGQGRCQQEKPEKEHLADWGESSRTRTAGTGEAATPESLSPPPGEGRTGVEAPRLLWLQRIAG